MTGYPPFSVNHKWELYGSRVCDDDPYGPGRKLHDQTQTQMETLEPINALYVIECANSGAVVHARWHQTKTPTGGGGKVSVKLSSPDSPPHNAALRQGRLVWNIPGGSPPRSQLI